jgi:hypothetical protein
MRLPEGLRVPKRLDVPSSIPPDRAHEQGKRCS